MLPPKILTTWINRNTHNIAASKTAAVLLAKQNMAEKFRPNAKSLAGTFLMRWKKITERM
jgi:hypothetical protein